MADNLLPSDTIRVGTKNDPTSSTPVGPYNFGQGGLFSAPGQDPSVFSAILAPFPGIMDELPLLNTEPDLNGQFGGFDNEHFTTLTGVSKGDLETFSNQPTADCADGPRSGTMSVATLLSPSGRYRFSPQAPISIYQSGRRATRAEPMTLRLMNGLGDRIGQLIPSLTEVNVSNTIMNEMARRMFEQGLSMKRFLAQRMWVGSPANNNGAAKDIQGFDLWISSGKHRDAYTSNLVPALDSNIMDFGLNDVYGATYDIMKYMEAMVAYLDFNARHEGLGEMWVGKIAMRPEAWEVISQVVGIRQYQEAMALVQNATRNVQLAISAEAALQERNEMRSNLKIPLRGRLHDVVLDDSIAELNSITAKLPAGSYASGVYFINTQVLGGQQTTYLKAYNHDNDNSAALARLAGANQTFTSDGGVFRWYINHKNGCIDWTVDVGPRLIVRCPQLCGRIDNVAYSPVQHFRSAFPDSAYFAAGGRTNSPTTNYYVSWQSTPANLG